MVCNEPVRFCIDNQLVKILLVANLTGFSRENYNYPNSNMFENYFEKLLFRVYKLSKWKLILLALIFDSFVLILNLMIDVSTNFNRSDEGDDFPRLSFIILFVGPVILSPILETLFFQTLLFRIGKRIPLNDGLVVVISSFIFALAHRLNITDIFFFFSSRSHSLRLLFNTQKQKRKSLLANLLTPCYS